MSSKNESLWLASGMAGENQARALNLPLEFTRVVVGDANGSYPPMDNTITALVNERITGEVLDHRLDPNDANQRILDMAIPPSLDFDAVELLLYAKYGEIEFPHSYFRLAAPYPIRTLENGGSQATLKFTIRVGGSSDFTVFVSPDLAHVAQDLWEESYNSLYITQNTVAQISRNKLHVFLNYADLQIPDSSGDKFQFMVDPSVDLTIGKCRLLPPENESIMVSGKLADAVNIKDKAVLHHAIKVNGIWKV
ncbi:phage tail protein [Thalassomonas actiniarum]|uniref:Phage tail protein n=1 Tax=Thalassomonas actiniarum TaxID=485447 RepID=A0AAE9YPC9_9GAMM|nr:phage tail protein [Thalassomonas actiniarum]WDD98382.1 phage tail protein [Thalassomonas actiniarum]